MAAQQILPKTLFLLTICFFILNTALTNAQTVPSSSTFNQDIVWENVYTQGNAGKVNRGLVDSDGNAAVIFMPDNESRIHKIDGNTGQLIWSQTINNTVGFGITEINDNNRVDYIVSGGIGNSQERWVARLNGNDGSTMWSQTYNYNGGNNSFDGIRMTIIGSDGFIYGAGFVGGDEAGTIFVVYAGQAMLMKIDPTTGNEVWTHNNPSAEYALAVVQDSNSDLYYGSAVYDANLKLTKLNTNGSEIWTQNLANTVEVIPADLTIDNNDVIYFGGHTARPGAGEPFDYTCIKLDVNANITWIKHYANPRNYSLSYIRNELYGIKVGTNGIYMFGGSGDESGSYSSTNPPYLSSDIWNGWVLITDFDGNILRSDLFCHENVHTATEYGDLTSDGYMIFNDTDAFGDTEVGVIKVNTANTVGGLADLVIDDNCMRLFPNPTAGFFKIIGDFQNFNIQILDISGAVYLDLSNQSSPLDIDLNSLPQGVYFVKVFHQSNNQLSIQQIIKE